MGSMTLKPAPDRHHDHGIRRSFTAAFANIVSACLQARGLAETWERTAGRIALSSLNAGLAARRTSHDQAVFDALSRETREISGAIRTLADEGLPLAKGLARRSIGVIRASRHVEMLQEARVRVAHSRRVGEAATQVADRVAREKAALAPDLERLGAIFRDLEWQLVRLKTVALYFRIEGSRDQDDGASFIDTSATLSDDTVALEGEGAALSALFKTLEDQLASGEAPTHHEE